MNLNVLLIEDEEITARILQRLLEGVGITVRQAGTVADALVELDFEPSLLVLDLMLPDGSGVEVLRSVRERNLACKVAVVSGASDPDLLSSVTALKPDAIFGKPLEFEDFVDWISSIFTEEPVVTYLRAG